MPGSPGSAGPGRAPGKPAERRHFGKRLWTRLGWFAALAYMSLIFWLSSIPGEELPLPEFVLVDKLAHFVTFSGLGALIAFRAGLTALLLGRPVTAWTKGGWLAPAIGLLYAAFDEFHQAFVPNRDSDVLDFVADALGIALGFWLARKWDARRMRNEK